MPELPEVETVRRSLHDAMAGRRVAAVEILDTRVRRRPTALALDVLAGRVVTRVRRRGKWLLADTDGAIVWIMHLRMSGQVRLGDSPAASPHLRAIAYLDGGTVVSYLDQRRFGEWFVLAAGEAGAFEARIGPDADTITAAQLRRALAGRTGALKAALCNQTIVGGVGNIYSDEALWRAGLRWDRPAGSLDAAETRRLAAALRTVLRRAIAAGGTSARDKLYLRADGEPGWFAVELEVYQREGEPCSRCATPIARQRFGASATRYCPTCQR
jgi:formamidopyrimidine-DNA glycosylase